LVVFVPLETAMLLLRQMTGITLCADTLWKWTQEVGGQMMHQVNEELQQQGKDAFPEQEAVEAGLEQSPLIIGADGVMVYLSAHNPTPLKARRNGERSKWAFWLASSEA
jgi:hypothetical protein